MDGEILGCANVYRDADGDIQLGACDLYPTLDDELMKRIGEDWPGVLTHVGVAEVRLVKPKEK